MVGRLQGSRTKIFILLILIGLFVAILAYQIWTRRIGPAPSIPSPSTSPMSAMEPKRSVRLFFSSPDEESLREEMREIKVARSMEDEATTTLQELIKGPRSELVSTIPAGTQLRQLYIDRRGTAYADFSPELRDNHPGGSRAELLTVYSIVDTLAYNFEQIKRVKIMIGGSEADTLAGHVDLRKPLRPRLDFDARG